MPEWRLQEQPPRAKEARGYLWGASGEVSEVLWEVSGIPGAPLRQPWASHVAPGSVRDFLGSLRQGGGRCLRGPSKVRGVIREITRASPEIPVGSPRDPRGSPGGKGGAPERMSSCQEIASCSMSTAAMVRYMRCKVEIWMRCLQTAVMLRILQH